MKSVREAFWNFFLPLSILLLALTREVAFFSRDLDYAGFSFKSVVLEVCFYALCFLDRDATHISSIVFCLIALRLAVQLWKLSRLSVVRTLPQFPYVRWHDYDHFLHGKKREQRWVADDYEDLICLCVFTVYASAVIVFTLQNFPDKEHRFVAKLAQFLSSTYGMTSLVYALPQVCVNHRLCTTGHMPWTVLVLRALGSFMLTAPDIRFLDLPTHRVLRSFCDEWILALFLAQTLYYKRRKRHHGRQAVEGGGAAMADGKAAVNRHRSARNRK